MKMNNNLIREKSFDFSLLIINLFNELVLNKEFILSRQLLRSGTSIGANVCEAQSAESKEDFIHKMSISLKEARETEYWLNLIYYAELIPKESFDLCMSELDSIIKILISIILTSKQKYRKDKKLF